MNELLILNENNEEVKSYAIYYTINDKNYIIYTTKEKDDSGYVVLHIAKVLKEVNNTENGIVPTGRYIGLEIADQSEWDSAKINIGEIVSNKQNNTPVNVTYMPVGEISGISIKSSKTFKLREDIVDSIIEDNGDQNVIPTEVKEDTDVSLQAYASEVPNYEVNLEDTNTLNPVDEFASAINPTTDFAPVEPVPSFDTNIDIDIPTIDDNYTNELPVENVVSETPIADGVESYDSLNNFDVAAPVVAPNPFEFTPAPEVPSYEAPVEEEKEINPYDILKQQREEEMVNNLATDNMVDIAPAPVIPVSELEEKGETEVSEEIPAPVNTFDMNEEININDTVEPEIAPSVESEENEETTIEPTVEETLSVEEEKEAEPEVKVEPISSDVFVDSIIADVSDILDKKEEVNTDAEEDYEQLYNEQLEKTVELEKELRELHDKLNNIKNIIE